MREQTGGGGAQLFVNQRALIDPAVVGLVVLQTEVRHVIAERIKEVVITIMVGPEKRPSLKYQAVVVCLDVVRNLQRGLAVGGEIHLVCHGQLRGERHGPEVCSGNHWRVDQKRQRSRGKFNLFLGLAGNRQRGAKLPAFRQLQTGLKGEFIGGKSLGIKQRLVPANHAQLIGCRRSSRESS